MGISKFLEELISGQDLSEQTIENIMLSCMEGHLNDVQIGSFLSLMRMKGETVSELTVAARVMQRVAHSIDLGPTLIDIVGTGGDCKNTFNVSTACSFVTAATGVKVAKHGNRSVSSKSGSIDLLEQAGFNLELNDTQLKKCMANFGLCFLFAPQFHQALRYAQSARRQLGIRSFFNLLGPIVNPAHVKRQVVGVFAEKWQSPIAQLLANLGSERALVVSSTDGLDEISIAAPTQIVEWRQSELQTWVLDPNDYGCFHPQLDEVVVESSGESLQLILSVLNGEKTPARSMILLNSAAAIYCANDQLDFSTALNLAKRAIDTGEARRVFEGLRDLTRVLL